MRIGRGEGRGRLQEAPSRGPGLRWRARRGCDSKWDKQPAGAVSAGVGDGPSPRGAVPACGFRGDRHPQILTVGLPGAVGPDGADRVGPRRGEAVFQRERLTVGLALLRGRAVAPIYRQPELVLNVLVNQPAAKGRELAQLDRLAESQALACGALPLTMPLLSLKFSMLKKRIGAAPCDSRLVAVRV